MTADDTPTTPPSAAPARVPAQPAPPPPSVPPPPAAPPTDPAVLRWLRTPRPDADVGVWRSNYRPRPDADPDRVPTRRLVSGALLAAFCGWMVGSLLWAGYLGPYWLWPLDAMAPDDPEGFVVAAYIYYALILTILVTAVARLGHWPALVRRLVLDPLREVRAQTQAAPPPGVDPVQWPELRAAGAAEAADRLAAEACAGRMTDVDVARISHAWAAARSAGTVAVQRFAAAVARDGAAAYLHPSGGRDIPQRTAAHDLLTRQVRIGTAADHDRTPHRRRGAGVALDPALLGTSLLAIGPSGSGKTTRLVRPVAESMCLQALAGQAAVVAVGPASADRGPADAYDVVVQLGRAHPDGAGADLDLYGGTTDPDEAALILAEGLVGDLGEAQRAAAALRAVLDPFRTAHDRFPTIPELRELLDGDPETVAALRAALKAREDKAGRAALREMDARARQAERPGDVGALLADRIARLDRPAFAGRFDPTGRTRQVSLRALDRPLRVRIDLPDRGHTEAARILARLILAQFTECATARADRSVFACLVLDDAAHTITAESLRGLQRLRSVNAGAVLTLRSMDDVPEALRGGLLGAVGCRMAFSGVTTWDGTVFADTWGKEWVESRDVTDRQIVAEGAGQKASHLARQLITGKPVTAQAVTVRRVERDRWSASDLASVQAGHAVLSVASVTGESAPPLLVNLR
ncbi:ATP-binding protein [Streptomyces lydicamycinicus]|uniref:ATP-binding protein n=1 Tax=Streptomyces lydicamycinicus TaxID=1546107 RepID=UPI003C2CDF5B